ncbi:MAG: hypothetical protein DRP11_03860 [Candidatus Aenigmatarchaeota archaeon]|nr:MAG: hypothetical protein DRP11_03860 [Candidatus Aenigmarchaeota archaeon]
MMKRRTQSLACFSLFLIILSVTALALKNPAAIYCKEMGYTMYIEETEAGEIGMCRISETISCPAWEFLTGTCGEEYSYCKKMGYGIKTVNDTNKCSNIPLSRCAVCVLEDGKEVEVTKLMGLNFQEGVCGDGKCVLGEDYVRCPQDCPSGSLDYYCDGVVDGKCDPDCTEETDPDCIRGILICGDGICKRGENRETCPIDCPSGVSDNFCDGIKDKKCDPDCSEEEDFDCHCGDGICNFGETSGDCPQDCREPEIDFNMVLLLISAAFLIGVAILIIHRKRKRSEELLKTLKMLKEGY